jgi:hypothetical protein
LVCGLKPVCKDPWGGVERDGVKREHALGIWLLKKKKKEESNKSKPQGTYFCSPKGGGGGGGGCSSGVSVV